MKRRFLFTALVLILGSALFAEGAREAPGRFDEADEITLTGTIDISRFPAVLTAGGEKYLVMVPPFAVDGIEITDGQQLTLTGYTHEGYGRFSSGEKVIAVSSAVIDGEEIEIDHPGYGGRFADGPMGYGGPGGAPRRGGYMHGGRHGGPQGRPGTQWGQGEPRGWR